MSLTAKSRQHLLDFWLEPVSYDDKKKDFSPSETQLAITGSLWIVDQPSCISVTDFPLIDFLRLPGLYYKLYLIIR